MPDQPRPLGITIISLLMAACLIAEVIADGANLPLLRHFPSDANVLLYALSFLLVPRIIAPTVLYFFWRGSEWALWLMMACAVLTLYMAIGLIDRLRAVSQPRNTITYAKIVLALFASVYLNISSSRDWFRIKGERTCRNTMISRMKAALSPAASDSSF